MNILIIDDDRTNLALFSHLLKDLPDVLTVEVSDPVEALEWCRSHEADLLLLDYMMPKMDGFEFLQQFRILSRPDCVPVIMITADAKTAVKHAALELSANDFLTKPVNKAELRARVSNMLSLRKAQLMQRERARSLSDEVQVIGAKLKANEHTTGDLLAKAAKLRDPETGEHLLRMASYARLLAANLNLSTQEQNDIFDAAPLHDIGKIGIPDSILLKVGCLNEEELKIMRTHPTIGAQILANGDSTLMKNAAVIALSHHEKFDGNGYPQRLAGEDITLYGRIVAIADVFDALTSNRPYKQAWSMQRAMQWLLQNAGTHFDPVLVAAFLRDEEKLLQIHDGFWDGVNCHEL